VVRLMPCNVARATGQMTWTPTEARIQFTDAGDRGDRQ
jgi:hypothetical protein